MYKFEISTTTDLINTADADDLGKDYLVPRLDLEGIRRASMAMLLLTEWNRSKKSPVHSAAVWSCLKQLRDEVNDLAGRLKS